MLDMEITTCGQVCCCSAVDTLADWAVRRRHVCPPIVREPTCRRRRGALPKRSARDSSFLQRRSRPDEAPRDQPLSTPGATLHFQQVRKRVLDGAPQGGGRVSACLNQIG